MAATTCLKCGAIVPDYETWFKEDCPTCLITLHPLIESP